MLLALLLFSGVESASAHSRPIRFDPEPGRVLGAAPTAVQGWFSSDIRNIETSFIHVLGPQGERVDSGQTRLSSDRRLMSVELRAGLGEGPYVVHWSTFDDADGEVFSACYVFFVGQAAADGAIASSQALDGGGRCPANPPINAASLSIEVETTGSSATVRMLTENLTVRPPDGTTVVPDVGHFHIYLNQAPLDVLSAHSHPEGEDEDSGSSSHSGHGSSANPSSPVHWYEDTYTFADLPPGRHYVAVSLFHDHTTPFSPPVVAEASFTIGAGHGSSGGVATWVLVVGLVLALGVGLTGGKWLAVQAAAGEGRNQL